MKWELDALKMLARNPTVPGVALGDAISEIERLRKIVKRLEKTDEDLGRAQFLLANILEYVKQYDPVYACEQIRKMLEGEEKK